MPRKSLRGEIKRIISESSDFVFMPGHSCPIKPPTHQTAIMNLCRVEILEEIFRNPLRTIFQGICA